MRGEAVNMTIQNYEHVTIAGITGGGKTELVKNYLSSFPQVVKFDTKGEALDDIQKKKNPWEQVHPKELTIVTHLDDLYHVETPYMIYNPTHEELEPEYYNEFYRWAYHKQNIAVWTDELMSVSDNPHHIPSYLKAILTRGRSRNTPSWACTQRPAGVHPLPLSQSSHLFAFDLPLLQDRKKLVGVSGANEFLELPTGYNFWYFKRGWRGATKGTITGY